MNTLPAEPEIGVRRRAGLSGAAWGVLVLTAVVYGAWLARLSFVVKGQRYFVLADDAM